MKTALTAALLSLALGPSLAFAQTTAPVAGPPTPYQTAPVTPGAPHPVQHHPEINKAIRHLEEAKQALKEAAHDYSGHREDAIRLIDQAEAQLRTGEMDANHR